MTFKIYQLGENSRDKLFHSYNEVNFDFNNYKEVYSDEIEVTGKVYTDLDTIYRIFNINHPEDFKGHSLSVSDLVELGDELYYCDDFGWTKVNKN